MLRIKRQTTHILACIATSCSFLGIIADYILSKPFHIDNVQLSYIFFFACFSLLLWDLYINGIMPEQNDSINSKIYIVFGFLGLLSLTLSLISLPFGIQFDENVISNSLEIFGVMSLLLSSILRFKSRLKQPIIVKILWILIVGLLITSFSPGLFAYIFICLVSIYAGKGILRIVGIPSIKNKYLTPFFSLVFWSLCLGILVGLGVPIKYACLLIWLITIFFIFWGIGEKSIYQGFIARDLFLLIIPLLLVYKYSLFGFFDYPGSANMDHWNYIVVGQYLWDFSRCSQEALPPIYRFSNDFACNFRYISPGILGLFSSFITTNGDAQPGAGVFLPWGLFIYCTSLNYIIEVVKAEKFNRYYFLFFGSLAGWPLMLIAASNFDNLLILPYMPIIFAFAVQTNFSKRWNIIFGAVISAIIYTYPEMTPFILLACGLFLLKRILDTKLTPKNTIISFILISGVVLILTFPYLPSAINFLIHQVTSTTGTKELLPGAGFWPELVEKKYRWIAFWGMGRNVSNNLILIFKAMVSSILYILLGYGCFIAVKKKEWAIISLFCFFISLILYFNFVRNYAYGSYKILLLFWWLIAYIIIIGFNYIQRNFLQYNKLFYSFGVLLYLAYFFTLILAAKNMVLLPYNSIKPFSQLENLPIKPNQSIAAILDDNYNNIWAAYYLRKNHIFLFPMRGYMNGSVDPFSNNVKQADLESTKYLLSENKLNFSTPGEIVWANTIYNLSFLPKEWAHIYSFSSENSLEQANGNSFFWVSNEPTSLKIISNFDGCAVVSLLSHLGPSLPEIPNRNLIIISNEENYFIPVSSGIVEQKITLKKGKENTLIFQSDNKPTVFLQPNGDKRIMLIGIENLSILPCQ